MNLCLCLFVHVSLFTCVCAGDQWVFQCALFCGFVDSLPNVGTPAVTNDRFQARLHECVSKFCLFLGSAQTIWLPGASQVRRYTSSNETTTLSLSLRFPDPTEKQHSVWHTLITETSISTLLAQVAAEDARTQRKTQSTYLLPLTRCHFPY